MEKKAGRERSGKNGEKKRDKKTIERIDCQGEFERTGKRENPFTKSKAVDKYGGRMERSLGKPEIQHYLLNAKRRGESSTRLGPKAARHMDGERNG